MQYRLYAVEKMTAALRKERKRVDLSFVCELAECPKCLAPVGYCCEVRFDGYWETYRMRTHAERWDLYVQRQREGGIFGGGAQGGDGSSDMAGSSG
jgi:hypothetical protein